MMGKNNFDTEAVSFRPAAPEDAKVASRLLFDTFPKKATFIIGLGDEERAKKFLRFLFEKPGHRLSYSATTMVVYQKRIIGLFTAFPGRQLNKLDRRLDGLILRQYGLRGKLAVVKRGWPLIFIKEATRKEFFLSNLVVRKRYRSRGIGELILAYVENKTRENHLDKLSLMVAIENKRARSFYQRHGFNTSAIHLESNKRVAHLGAGYYLMVKDLDR